MDMLGFNIAIVIMFASLIAFCVMVVMGASGFDWYDFFKGLTRDKPKEDTKEDFAELKTTLDRARDRELLMLQCREQYAMTDVERKFNAMCLQILEDNPEICTIDELMTELDKIDKNLFKENSNEN